MSYYCNTVGWTWWDWSLILRTLSFFNALTLLVGSFDPCKPVPDMIYNVSCSFADWWSVAAAVRRHLATNDEQRAADGSSSSSSSSSSLKFLEWPKQQRHHEDHYKRLCLMNCRVMSFAADSAVDMDASTSTEVGNLPPPIDILWHPVSSFYDSADHGRCMLVTIINLLLLLYRLFGIRSNRSLVTFSVALCISLGRECGCCLKRLIFAMTYDAVSDAQWLKCKIRGGGTLHSGLGPWQWSCAFP